MGARSSLRGYFANSPQEAYLPVENFGFIDSLVVTYPDVNDGLVSGDDHIRGVKLTLKNSFPNASGPITRALGTKFGFMATADGDASGPAFSFGSEPGLGFYRKSAGTIAYPGTLRGIGAIPPGFILDFAGPSPPDGWLICDGQLVSTTTYPDLFASIGYTWGGSGAQFAVPNLVRRFRRHRDNSSFAGAVGNLQGNQIGSHGHAASSDVQGWHEHYLDLWSSGMNRSNPHSHPASGSGIGVEGGFSVGVYAPSGPLQGVTIGATDINHEHHVTGNTAGNGSHSHNINVAAVGGNETRPDSATVMACIKV